MVVITNNGNLLGSNTGGAMNLSIHDAAILFAAIAGFCMVIGGMLLIYRGSLVLAGTDSSTTLSIEWKNDFKLNTQAPGIAFFIIGLLFSVVSIYASKQI
jgi:predicted permease